MLCGPCCPGTLPFLANHNCFYPVARATPGSGFFDAQRFDTYDVSTATASIRVNYGPGMSLNDTDDYRKMVPVDESVVKQVKGIAMAHMKQGFGNVKKGEIWTVDRKLFCPEKSNCKLSPKNRGLEPAMARISVPQSGAMWWHWILKSAFRHHGHSMRSFTVRRLGPALLLVLRNLWYCHSVTASYMMNSQFIPSIINGSRGVFKSLYYI